MIPENSLEDLSISRGSVFDIIFLISGTPEINGDFDRKSTGVGGSLAGSTLKHFCVLLFFG